MSSSAFDPNLLPDQPLPADDLEARRRSCARLVIGSVLVDPACMADVAQIVTLADFPDGAERHVFCAMLAVHRAGHVVTTDRLYEVLREGGCITAVESLLIASAMAANDARRGAEYAAQLAALREGAAA